MELITLNLGFTVFVILVEDSNGASEIVAVALLANEDKETFRWFLSTFKKDNAIFVGQIKCVMGDKDLLQRTVIKEIFPDVAVYYICLFHTLKTMKREISREKLNITNQQRMESFELLQKLAYSRSDEEYDKNYELLLKTVPPAIITYYDKNWHSIREEWTVYSMCHGNLLNRTNNRLESINNKLKQVIQRNSSLAEFIKSFFIFLNSHGQERNDRTARLILTRSIAKLDKNSPQFKYEEFLTSYASKYVSAQISASEKGECICTDNILHFYNVTSKEVTYDVTTMGCTCVNFKSMFLPCKHNIFAVRKLENLEFFDQALCHKRWTNQFFFKHQRVAYMHDDNSKNTIFEPVSVAHVEGSTTVQTVNQKRKKALLLTNSLTNLISLSNNSSFDYKMSVLQNIETFWREGHEVAVTSIDTTNSNNEDIVETMDLTNMTVAPNVIEEYNEPLKATTSHGIKSKLLPETKSMATEMQLDTTTEVAISYENYVAGSQIDAAGNKNEMGANNNVISDIKLPPKIKTKGRPKGAQLTVIGLKRKRNNK